MNCSTCGAPLTTFNRDMMSNRCAGCARGTSPAAVQARHAEYFRKHPETTEASIDARGVLSTLPRFTAGAIVMAACMLVPDAISARSTFVSGIVITIGFAIASAVAIAGAHPLDVKRFRVFSWAAIVPMAASWLFATFAPGSRPHMVPIVAVGTAVGVLFGVLVMQMLDGGSKRATIEALRAFHAGQPFPMR